MSSRTADQIVDSMRHGAVRPHSGIADLEVHAVRWARALSIVTNDIAAARARQIRVGSLAAHAFQRQSREAVQLGADLILWLFLFDDAIGEAQDGLDIAEHRKILGTYTRVLRTGELPARSTPFHVALLDLLHRAEALGATEDWKARFADDMEGYFLGCGDETQYRRSGETPRVAEYRDLRARTVGTSAVFAVLELHHGCVPREHMMREDVREVRRIAALLTAWVNDAYSYPKESAAGDPLNLVRALESEYGLDPKTAFEEAAEVYNLDLGELERLIAGIRASPIPLSLDAYLDGLVDWVHGNRVWTGTCGRYI